MADIGEGVCCKPESHPDQDGPYTDINVNFTEDGMKQCPNGTFLKGLYKTKCIDSRLACYAFLERCPLFLSNLSFLLTIFDSDSDQHLVSPYNISLKSHIKHRRIIEMIIN